MIYFIMFNSVETQVNRNREKFRTLPSLVDSFIHSDVDSDGRDNARKVNILPVSQGKETALELLKGTGTNHYITCSPVDHLQ